MQCVLIQHYSIRDKIAVALNCNLIRAFTGNKKKWLPKMTENMDQLEKLYLLSLFICTQHVPVTVGDMGRMA